MTNDLNAHMSNPIARANVFHRLFIAPILQERSSEGVGLLAEKDFHTNLKGFCYMSLVNNAVALAKLIGKNANGKMSDAQKYSRRFLIDTTASPEGTIRHDDALDIFGNHKMFSKGFKDGAADAYQRRETWVKRNTKRSRAEDDVPDGEEATVRNPLLELNFRRLFFAPRPHAEGTTSYKGPHCDDSLARSSVGLALASLDEEELKWLSQLLALDASANPPSASVGPDSPEWHIVADGMLVMGEALNNQDKQLPLEILKRCVGDESIDTLLKEAASKTPPISAWELVVTLVLPTNKKTHDWLHAMYAKTRVEGVEEDLTKSSSAVREVVSVGGSQSPHSTTLPQASQPVDDDITFATVDDVPALMATTPNRLPWPVVVAHRKALSDSSITAFEMSHHYMVAELKSYILGEHSAGRAHGGLPAKLPATKAALADLIISMRK